MLIRFSLFTFLMIFVICQTATVHDHKDDAIELSNQFKSLTPQQLAELDEFLSRKLDESVTSGEVLYRNTRRPQGKSRVKRDALWKMTEVLDCVRRLQFYKGKSKLDVFSEMLNCYRRLKASG